MATKKITSESIVDMYSDYLLNNAHPPKTVHQFCQLFPMEESIFYDHFSGFEAINRRIMRQFMTSCLALLTKSPEYEQYAPKEKLLSFYYTFFELLTLNRSLALCIIPSNSIEWYKSDVINGLKEPFLNYIHGLEIPSIDLKLGRLESIKDQGLDHTAWAQLLLTLRFWIKDTSAGFEKTDQWIEKSIQAGFNLMASDTLNSLLDLGKFIWKESIIPIKNKI